MDRETRALLLEAFEKYDLDGDGYITLEEMAQALRVIDPDVAIDDILSAINDSDADRDGRISFDEFVKMNLL
jgi:Ca2+-binding EF-hand superfamily protein